MGDGIPRRKWVLIVEDDPDIRQLFTEECHRAGYKVLSCTTTIDAFRMLANQRFDCILLDMRLERGAGDQIILIIRRDPLGFNFATPIIVVSGELSVEIVNKVRSSVSSFFVKPFDLAAVMTKVTSICDIA
jgi:two-component system OmpR family response regulator